MQSTNDEEGSVEWLDMQNADKLNQLKSEVANSVECVVIIADESCRKKAEKTFPGGMIATSEEIKGGEFEKVILFDFLSGKYNENYFYEAGTCYNPNIGMPSNHPKNLDKAHYAKLFNKFFVAATRATKGVVFVETTSSRADKDSKALYKDLFSGQLQGASEELEASSLEQVISKINSSHVKWETYFLLQCVKKATDLMNNDALANSSDETNGSNYSEYLNNLKGILVSRNISTEDQIMQNIEGLLARFTPKEPYVQTTSSLSSTSVDNHDTSSKQGAAAESDDKEEQISRKTSRSKGKNKKQNSKAQEDHEDKQRSTQNSKPKKLNSKAQSNDKNLNVANQQEHKPVKP